MKQGIYGYDLLISEIMVCIANMSKGQILITLPSEKAQCGSVIHIVKGRDNSSNGKPVSATAGLQGYMQERPKHPLISITRLWKTQAFLLRRVSLTAIILHESKPEWVTKTGNTTLVSAADGVICRLLSQPMLWIWIWSSTLWEEVRAITDVLIVPNHLCAHVLTSASLMLPPLQTPISDRRHNSWCHPHISLSQTTLLSQIISPSQTFDMISR